MNVDESLVCGQSDGSSSLKQPAEKPEKQEPDTVEKMQIDREPLEQKGDNGAEDKLAKSGTQVPDLGIDELRAFSEDVMKNSTWDLVSHPSENLKLDSSLEKLGLQRESTVDESILDQLESEPVNEFENPTIEQLELIVKDTIGNASFDVELGDKEPSRPLDKSDDLDVIENASVTVGVGDKEPSLSLDQNEGLGLPPESQRMLGIPSMGLSERTERATTDHINGSASGGKKTPSQLRKRKSISTPPVTSTRTLRSRTKEQPETPETNNVAAEIIGDRKKKKKRKKKQMGETPVDDFSRIRSRLKYLLKRINCEQHFIDAYSGEGWKGQSLEKIKPENELRRAKSHILHYKLKIRDLFQRVDLLLAEGKLPESLFDSEGEIDSEDIFCAKCGSMELPDNNDIILCDGACERGFHQFCVEPPLLNEDIPPDDEGWLCPGCDCKDDCLDLLNDFYGTKLSIVDSWEKVFPEEAASAVSGKTLDDSSGFPSDDSEDDDYDPGKPELDETKQRDELGSDELSLDELGSDESSSDESGYFSAPEDVAASPKTEQNLGVPSDESEDDEYDPEAPDDDEQVKQESSSSDFTSDSEDLGAFVDNAPLTEDQGQTSRDGEKLEVGKGKGQSLRAELSYLLDSSETPVSEKRHVKRFDYKKLHDETYGNLSSDSSDEDFKESAGGQKREKSSAKSTKKSPITENGEDIEPKDSNHKESVRRPKRAGKKHKVEDRNNSSTAYKKLGEVVSQNLGVPSDESEDDEFDPEAPDDDEQVKQESSSSDFSSDSEDLGAFGDNASLTEDQGQTSRDGKKLEAGRGKGQSLRAELSYLLDSSETPVSGKRHVKRFDYKKLHDETYGNVSSDSSDEAFEESAGGQKRKKNSAKSTNKSPVEENGEDIDHDEIEHTPKRAGKKHKVKDRNNSLTARKRSSKAESGTRRPFKKLGEVVSQKLSEFFKENQYPPRPEKERLAKDAGLTIQQVSKWFENARWSYRHSATMGSNVLAGPSKKSPDIKQKMVGQENSSIDVDKAASSEPKCQTVDTIGESKEASGKNSGSPKSRKRKGKGKMDNQESVQNLVDKAASSEAKCQTVDTIGESKEAGGKISGTPKSKTRKGKGKMVNGQISNFFLPVPNLVNEAASSKAKCQTADMIGESKEASGKMSGAPKPKKRKGKMDNQESVQNLVNETASSEAKFQTADMIGESKEAGGKMSGTPKSKKRKGKMDNQESVQNMVDKAASSEAKCQTADTIGESKEAGGKMSGTPKSRKRKGKMDNQESVQNLVNEAATSEAKCQTADMIGESMEAGGKMSGTPKSKKRKGKMAEQESVQNSSHEKTQKEKSQADMPTQTQVRRSSRRHPGK